MKMSDEQFESILNRAENGEELKEVEVLDTLSAIFDIPVERLELELAKIRGEELLTFDEVMANL